jgi:DNA-binding transcriptional regulator YiaG
VKKCIECGKRIEYHAYKGVLVGSYKKLKIGDTVGPLCLSHYCNLHAAKLFFVECEQSAELVGPIIEKILDKLGCSSKDLARQLGAGVSSFSIWKKNRRGPCTDMYRKIMQIARECGAI